MQKVLSRSMWIQTKLISKYTKVNQYEMVLYNEKPQTKSFVVRFDEHNQELCLPDVVKNIKSRGSKTLFSTESNYFILHTNGAINTPVIEEGVYGEEMPVVTFVDIVKWLAKTPDSSNKDPEETGTTGARIGRLDAANEAGFFHRTNRSRLKDIKKKLKDKVDTEPTEPKKSEE